MSEHDEEATSGDDWVYTEEAPHGVNTETGEIIEQTPQEAADADGSDELIKKAEKAQTNYAKRIRDIFGDAAPQYDCPHCNGLGLVWNLDEPKRKLKHPPELVACERCGGEGEVETGSKNPLHETTVCTACNATGWKVQATQPENVTPIQPTAPVPSATLSSPVMGWMNADGVFQPLGATQAGNG